MKSFVLVLLLFGYVVAQNIPMPLANGDTWVAANGMEITMSSQTQGTLKLVGSAAALSVTGRISGTNDYYGSVMLGSTAGSTCLTVHPASPSDTVVGLAHRTPLNSFTGTFVAPAMFTPAASSCTNPNSPEFEIVVINYGSSGFTPLKCPKILYDKIKYSIDGQCEKSGATIDGTNKDRLILDVNNCPTASSAYGASGATLYCLTSFEKNGKIFLFLQDSTTSSGNLYCLSYEVKNMMLEASLLKGSCDALQTPTSIGGSTSGHLFTGKISSAYTTKAGFAILVCTILSVMRAVFF